MTLKTLKEVFDACRARWGLNSQILMLAEESSELTVATLHLFRSEKGSLEEFAEEIADVELMIDEIKYYFRDVCLPSRINKHRRTKIRRLRELLHACGE